jgi:CrcB protein
MTPVWQKPTRRSVLIYLWIAAGGALGSVARFGLSHLVATHIGETFPWGTLIINVTGSFAIGFFGTLTDPEGTVMVSPDFRRFFMVGICGGYTTFSSFSLQTLSLARGGQWLGAGANILASNLGCLVAVWLGYVCAAALRK